MLKLDLGQLQEAYYSIMTIMHFYAYEDGPSLEELEEAKKDLKRLGIEAVNL